MDWRTYYKEHTMTPEQAVSVIHDGDRVVFGHAVGEPIIFQRTMARMAEQFHNVEVAHMVYLGSGEYLQPGMERHFRHNALFVGGPGAQAHRRAPRGLHAGILLGRTAYVPRQHPAGGCFRVHLLASGRARLRFARPVVRLRRTGGQICENRYR